MDSMFGLSINKGQERVFFLIMDSIHKMVLIDPVRLGNLEQKTIRYSLPDPTLNALQRGQESMSQILQLDDMSNEERVNAYNEAQRKFLLQQKKYLYKKKKPVSVVVKNLPELEKSPAENIETTDDATPDEIEENIIDSVPSSMKQRAKSLIKMIKSGTDMTWNDKGELVYKDQVVPGTNIVDLVNDALRKRKHFEPRGWETFTSGLRELNVPQDIVRNKDRWKVMSKQYVEKGDRVPSYIQTSTPVKKKKSPFDDPLSTIRSFSDVTKNWDPY